MPSTIDETHRGHTVNCLREDGGSFARFFDTRVEAVEYAVTTVIWNKFAIAANIWMETEHVPLGPSTFEFFVQITRINPYEEAK